MWVSVAAGDVLGAKAAGQTCLDLFTRLATQEPQAFERYRAETERRLQALDAELDP